MRFLSVKLKQSSISISIVASAIWLVSGPANGLPRDSPYCGTRTAQNAKEHDACMKLSAPSNPVKGQIPDGGSNGGSQGRPIPYPSPKKGNYRDCVQAMQGQQHMKPAYISIYCRKLYPL